MGFPNQDPDQTRERFADSDHQIAEPLTVK